MRRLRRGWLLLLILSACVTTVSDSVLLGAGTSFLTSGFNTPRVDWVVFVFFFLPASLLLDVWMVQCIWLVVVPISRRLTGSPLQQLVLASLVGCGLPVGLAFARYEVFSVLGRLFSLRERFGWEASGIVWDVLLAAPGFTLWLLAAAVVALVALLLGSRIERRFIGDKSAFEAPRTRPLLRSTLITTVLALSTFLFAGTVGEGLGFGLGRKVSGRLAFAVVDRGTDFDFDGYGMLSRPPDLAPFDRRVFPYALDVPGNGLDENGLAGDHPVGERWPGSDPIDPSGGARPHFLLVFLESFRQDLIEQQTPDGRPVTPFLRRLAREGSASEHAYVHSPWTLESRSQLFSGRYLAEPGAPTLIDDFKGRGYTVAHFSGQDESYGDSEAILGTGRADRFYHARHDLDRRTSASTMPVSLQVSWRTLTERIDEYLEEWDGEGPLFLYANVVDTHFPYWHEEVEDLLGVAPLLESDIREENAEHLRAAYANTAANVDRAVEHIVASFRRKIGGADHAILVTADHGQALYEDGRLGHGLTLDDALTKVPLIAWGIGGEWPEPIGVTDVRGLLARHLGRERGGAGVPRATFVPDADRRILQYAPRVSKPVFIALRSIEDRIEYAFLRDQLSRVDGSGRVPLDRAVFHEPFEQMVWRWEALTLRDASQQPDAGGDD